MATGVLGRVRANQIEQMFPLGVVAVVFVHDFHLPEMDSFKADVNVGRCLIVEPKLGFDAAFVRDLRIPSHWPALFGCASPATQSEPASNNRARGFIIIIFQQWFQWFEPELI